MGYNSRHSQVSGADRWVGMQLGAGTGGSRVHYQTAGTGVVTHAAMHWGWRYPMACAAAASSCCATVLYIQARLLDLGGCQSVDNPAQRGLPGGALHLFQHLAIQPGIPGPLHPKHRSLQDRDVVQMTGLQLQQRSGVLQWSWRLCQQVTHAHAVTVIDAGQRHVLAYGLAYAC